MCTIHRSTRVIPVSMVIATLLIILLASAGLVLANKDSIPMIKEPTSSTPTGWGDDGIFEVGVEWEDVFPNPADNRNYWNVSCDGVYNFLGGAGWTQRYRWVNYWAYEKDFKLWSQGGGWEDSYTDDVDLAMVCTHGAHATDPVYQQTLSAIYFGSTQDDHFASPGEAYMAFGDKDLEYLAIDSCNILEDTSLVYWASTFNGLHLLLSFSNEMHVDPYGDGLYWGLFMTFPGTPFTLNQAWFAAIDINQPSDVCARVVAESQSNFNEHWWNTWPDPAVDSEKWFWTHCSHGLVYGRESTNRADVIAVPVLRVVDRLVNEEYVQGTIAPAFNMNGEIGTREPFYYMTDTTGGITQTLLVDKITGSFSYHNLSKLWTTPIVTYTLPTERQAGDLIYDWFDLTPAGELPGAWYRTAGYIYDPEEISNLVISPAANGDLQGQTTLDIPTDVSMTYPRAISVLASTASGPQMVYYPIFGPGAKMLIYLGDQGEIIGAQGGSRDVQVMTDTVQILDSALVWDMFLANPSLSIGEIPMIADTITHTLPTLGYYEMPYYIHQEELIPVWEFRSYFYLDGNLVTQDYPVYLPAAAEYLPPTVTIVNPVDGDTFLAGQPINFAGSITGGLAPYSITWAADVDGFLGDTLSLTHPLGSIFRGDAASTQVVTLQVVDANGLTGSDTITLKIQPLVWLPLALK